jgi:hypothetical protein
MVTGYDPTISTRASVQLEDSHRMNSPGQHDPELSWARERSAKENTARLAIVVTMGLVVFVLIWWLVVH